MFPAITSALDSTTTTNSYPEKPVIYPPDYRADDQVQKQVVKERTLAEKAALEKEKTALKVKRLDLRESIKEKREAVKTEFQQKRAEFKQRLQTLRDENKKTVVEKVDTRLSTINTNRTEHMTEVLQKLDEILVKLSTKVSELKTSGVDVTGAETALAAATTSVESAKNTVSTQAAKEYVAQITDDTTLKQEVWTASNLLKTDLKSTHTTVVDARKAVRNAAAEVAKLKSKLNSAGDTISSAEGTISQ